MQDAAADVGALVALDRHVGRDGEIIQIGSLIIVGKCQFDFAQRSLTLGRGEDIVVEQVGFTVAVGGGQGVYGRIHLYRSCRCACFDTECLGNFVGERHGCHIITQGGVFLNDVDLSERAFQFDTLCESTCFFFDGKA